MIGGMKMDYKILIVEDERNLREILCDYFKSKSELPIAAENGMKALELAENQDFDAVLLDIMMPEEMNPVQIQVLA